MAEFDLPQFDGLLTTTRAVRKRLDLERPVEPEVIQECIRIAIQAPTGGGYVEKWRWLVVTDPDLASPVGGALSRHHAGQWGV